MNILFLSQRVPYPPNKGDKLRSFNEIKFLSQRHDVSLVCLADNAQDLQYERELKQYCHSIDIVFRPMFRAKLRSLFYLLSTVPLTLPYFYSKKLRSIVHQRLQERKYDIIFVYCSSMAQYVEDIRNIPKVIDFVDVDSEKWAQYARYTRFPMSSVYRAESKRLRRYEALLAQTFQHCFLVSEKEVEDFRTLVYPCSTITPLLNGIDHTDFQPSQEPYDPNVLLFTGTMDYWANVKTMLYFAEKIFPSVQKLIPDVKLYIVGRNPTPEIRRLEENNSNIVVTGAVDHVQPYFVKAAVFVAPMQIARGIQIKILEAMAMAVPVVTTSLGLEGIMATPGKDIVVEDHPERFAKQVVQLMQDAELRKTISANARKTIEQQYNWDKNLRKLEEILVEVVK